MRIPSPGQPRVTVHARPEGTPNITMLWHNPRLRKTVPRYDDTTKIPGYVCAWGEERGEAQSTLAKWFATAGYRVEPDPAHAAWFERLRRHLVDTDFADTV